MKKRVGIIKRLFCLLLVFLFSINSFAAVVSDNDGSAFITKAEFDSLKNSFQGQLDEYNTSIDSKIDGAIASYLAGIRVSLPWNIKNKSVKFLNTWKYKVPQSYYQIALNTTSVTYGVSGFAPPIPKEDYSWPGVERSCMYGSPVTSQKMSQIQKGNFTASTNTMIMFYVVFEGLNTAIDRDEIYNKLNSLTGNHIKKYYNGDVDVYDDMVKSYLGIQKEDFKKVSIGMWWSDSMFRPLSWTITNYPPLGC